MKTTVAVFLLLGRYRKHGYVNMYLTWSKAQNYCREHLSTISNEELWPLYAKLSKKLLYFMLDFLEILKQEHVEVVYRWSSNIWQLGDRRTNLQWTMWQCQKQPISQYYLQLANTIFCMEVFELILVQQESIWEETLQYCRQPYTDLAILSSVWLWQKLNKSTAAQTEDVWIYSLHSTLSLVTGFG